MPARQQLNVRMTVQQVGVLSGILRGTAQGTVPADVTAAACAFLESTYFEAIAGSSESPPLEADEKWDALIALDYLATDSTVGSLAVTPDPL